MKPLSALGYLNLTTLSKPVANRSIYKSIKKNRFRSIVEIGMEDGERALNMLRVASKFAVTPNLRYTGVDLFEAAERAEPLKLIEMHKRLKIEGVKVQLVPGELGSAVSRIANSHVRTDLIVIGHGFDEVQLEQSWFFMPRMLHSGSVVMIQRRPEESFEVYNRLQIEKLATNSPNRQSKAA